MRNSRRERAGDFTLHVGWTKRLHGVWVDYMRGAGTQEFVAIHES